MALAGCSKSAGRARSTARSGVRSLRQRLLHPPGGQVLTTLRLLASYPSCTDTKAVERLLVQGGLRLAATLNTIFAPIADEAGFSPATDAAQEEEERAWTRHGVYWGWLQEEEGEVH